MFASLFVSVSVCLTQYFSAHFSMFVSMRVGMCVSMFTSCQYVSLYVCPFHNPSVVVFTSQRPMDLAQALVQHDKLTESALHCQVLEVPAAQIKLLGCRFL